MQDGTGGVVAYVLLRGGSLIEPAPVARPAIPRRGGAVAVWRRRKGHAVLVIRDGL